MCESCFCREISETHAAMKSVEESKSQLLMTTNELQMKLEVLVSDFDSNLSLIP